LKVTVRRPGQAAVPGGPGASGPAPDLQGTNFCGTVGSESAPRLRLRLGARPGEPAAPS
jgi:hypothetical protein